MRALRNGKAGRGMECTWESASLGQTLATTWYGLSMLDFKFGFASVDACLNARVPLSLDWHACR